MALEIATSRAYEDEYGDIMMEKLSETAYERTIESFRAFCHFLRYLYADVSCVLEPPEGGWPEINEETFAPLNKSKKAIMLMRNMPYIANACGIYLDTQLVDYRSRRVLSDCAAGDMDLTKVMTQAYNSDVSPDGIGLGYGQNRETSCFLLEASYGIVYWPGCPFGRTDFGPRLEWTRDWRFRHTGEYRWEARWMNQAAWPVDEFFTFLVSKFRSLDIIPYDSYRVVSTTLPDTFEATHRSLIPCLRKIYVKHGWPDSFRKEECAAEVAKLDIRELSGCQFA